MARHYDRRHHYSDCIVNACQRLRLLEADILFVSFLFLFLFLLLFRWWGQGEGKGGGPYVRRLPKKTEEKINSGQPLGRVLFFFGFFFGGGVVLFRDAALVRIFDGSRNGKPPKKTLDFIVYSSFFSSSSADYFVLFFMFLEVPMGGVSRLETVFLLSICFVSLFCFICVFVCVFYCFFCEGTKRKFPTGTMSSFLFSVKLGKTKNTRKCFKTNTRGSQNSNPIDENFPSKIKKNLKKGNKNRHTKKTRPTPQRPNSKCVRGQRRGGGARGAGLGNLINV